MTDTVSSAVHEHAERIDMLEDDVDEIVNSLPDIYKAVNSLVEETERGNEILEKYRRLIEVVIAIIGLIASKPVIIDLLNS